MKNPVKIRLVSNYYRRVQPYTVYNLRFDKKNDNFYHSLSKRLNEEIYLLSALLSIFFWIGMQIVKIAKNIEDSPIKFEKLIIDQSWTYLWTWLKSGQVEKSTDLNANKHTYK